MSNRKREYVYKKMIQSDIEILWQLYNRRILSTHQLMLINKYNKWHIYNKIKKIRDWHCLESEYMTGYQSKRGGGKYHKITNKGIKILKELGYNVPLQTDDLKVNKYRVQYMLLFNDLWITFKDTKWNVKDSRQVKQEYQLNRGDGLQGSLTNKKGEEYPFYILSGRTTKRVLNKIKQEVSSYSFLNMLLFCSGKESYDQIIKEFDDSDILKYKRFFILPLQFSKKYLLNFSEPLQLEKYIENNEGIEVLGDKKSIYTDFTKVVRYKGEEYYLVNLLDTDLTKIFKIKQYRKEQYEKDGRKVLILTINTLFETHKELLKHVHHVDYHVVDNGKLNGYFNQLTFLRNAY